VKELHCKDVGFDCQGVVRGASDEEVMRQAAEHARMDHGVQELDDATASKIRSQIRTVMS
jgi:predicted small metal-binding protein